MESEAKNTSVIKKIFKFEKIATIIGFVVDLFTIISILLAINLGNGNIRPYITPELAFGIWIIALYSYMAYLHSYWEKHQAEFEFENSFREFLYLDLFRHFRRPVVLMPFVLLIVVLVPIVIASPILSIVFSIGVVVLLMLGAAFVDSKNSLTNIFKAEEKVINENWEYLQGRIQMELADEQWISIYCLRDVSTVLGININSFSYAFAKYAYENPRNVKYGKVYYNESGETVSISNQDLLINLENLNEDLYFS